MENNPRKYGNPPFRVALLHGGPGTAGGMAPLAKELAKLHGVLKPLQTADSIGGQVEELKCILEEHGETPVTMIGHSWGAWLGWIFAARYPRMVGRLILVSSGGFEERYAAATRYVEMNPVAGGLVANPGEYRWSSAAPHLAGKDDQLVTVKPLLDIVVDWQGFLAMTDEEELSLLKKHERSGRPLGEASSVERLETETERLLRPAKRGPKPKA